MLWTVTSYYLIAWVNDITESSPKGECIGEMLIKCENATNKMNNKNGQHKSRSEADSQLRSLELLIYIPLD